jgi:hypothetical protein
MEAKLLTRCPYTLKPISELEEDSREHIILDALGGPDGYSVRACRSANNQLGETIDAAFLKNPLIQMQRSKVGIKSRSGVADWKMSGETIEGKRPVDITIPHEGPVDVRHKKPVDKNTDSYTIIVPPDQSDKLLKEIKENLRKKGKQIADIETTQVDSQELHARLNINLTEIQSGMMKMAYLACCDYLGDEFLDDPLNPEWQKAIRARTAKESEDIKIYGKSLSEIGTLDFVFPKLAEHEHGIVIFSLNQSAPIVGVRLFGDPLFTAVVLASENKDYGLSEGDGIVITCDSKSGSIRREPWLPQLLKKMG